MNKRIFLIIFFLFFNNNWAQCDPEELTNLLYSTDVHDRIDAAQRIADCNLDELKPLLEERFYDEEYLYAAHRILFALAKLDSDNLEHITVDFINNVDNLTNLTPDDPLSSKVYATQILFNFHNYSTIDYIFQIVDRDRPNFNPITIFLLIEFISNSDLIQYREYAKTELVNHLNTDADYITRSVALDRLAASYGIQLIDLILDKVYNEQERILRSTALKVLLNINYDNSRSVFYERLQDDPNRDVRWEISDSILYYWGEPQDLKKIIDYHPNEPDTIVKKDMQHSTNVFIPSKPETLNWNDLATRLISYTDEMYGYGWIADEHTRDYYKDKLKEVINFMNSSQLAQACQTISLHILGMLENHLNEELVTTEAYKFLHYYTVYIKEEIEENYGACPY
jgi:hypothetical protein